MECTIHRGVKEARDYGNINEIWAFNLVPNWESVTTQDILSERMWQLK